MMSELKVLAVSIASVTMYSSLVLAEDYGYVSDNHSWSLSCNNSGYVLQSQYPVTRFHEAGAGSSVTRERETLYLGRSCDASNSVLGDGKWCWANGGFFAELGEYRMGFPRQELICPNEADDVLDCRC
ncbi:MAG: hypothetical protein AAGA50_02205 [Pseudomonadota bacterium]